MKRARSPVPSSPPRRTARRFMPMDQCYLLDGYPDRPLQCDGFAFRCPVCLAAPLAADCATCGGRGELVLNDPRVHLAPGQKLPREARA